MLSEETELLARIEDLIQLARKRHTPVFSEFLTPAQQAFLRNNRQLSRRNILRFAGGYEEAQRAMAVLLPEEGHDFHPPVSILCVQYKGDRLSHRDLLGALMGLGIKRETIGDIIEHTNPQYIICDSKLADYIIQHFTKAGRANVTCAYSILPEIPPPQMQEITATVASLQLDSVVAEGFSLSRGKAAEAIRHGIVYVNWTLITSVSKEVGPGDQISLRGKGKIRLDEISGLSRKGRRFIKLSRFV